MHWVKAPGGGDGGGFGPGRGRVSRHPGRRDGTPDTPDCVSVQGVPLLASVASVTSLL